jgi:hypothetical protein
MSINSEVQVDEFQQVSSSWPSMEMLPAAAAAAAAGWFEEGFLNTNCPAADAMPWLCGGVHMVALDGLKMLVTRAHSIELLLLLLLLLLQTGAYLHIVNRSVA